MEGYEELGVVLGSGTYGVVLKARCRKTGEAVAIKRFKLSEKAPQVRKTAQREVALLRSLGHANIIALREAQRHQGRLLLVFEYVPRTVLQELEQQRRGLGEAAVRRLGWQLLHAVAYLHGRGILHRDIKPENLLLTEEGVLKLCDFGFARATGAGAGAAANCEACSGDTGESGGRQDGSGSDDGTGGSNEAEEEEEEEEEEENSDFGGRYSQYVATRWYRAPELLLGEGRYGPAVDIWALGCLLAEVQTGAPLFPGESDADQLTLILRCFGRAALEPLPRRDPHPTFAATKAALPQKAHTLRRRLRAVPAPLLAVIERCLQPDPRLRPSAEELLQSPYFASPEAWLPPALLHLLGPEAQQQAQQQQQQQGAGDTAGTGAAPTATKRRRVRRSAEGSSSPAEAPVSGGAEEAEGGAKDTACEASAPPPPPSFSISVRAGGPHPAERPAPLLDAGQGSARRGRELPEHGGHGLAAPQECPSQLAPGWVPLPGQAASPGLGQIMRWLPIIGPETRRVHCVTRAAALKGLAPQQLFPEAAARDAASGGREQANKN